MTFKGAQYGRSHKGVYTEVGRTLSNDKRRASIEEADNKVHPSNLGVRTVGLSTDRVDRLSQVLTDFIERKRL